MTSDSFPEQPGANSEGSGHAGQPVLARGAPLQEAAAATILLHGRGADANSILALADEIDRPGPVPGPAQVPGRPPGRKHLAYLAPQAARSEWYPNRFLAPLDQNEPWLSSALSTVGGLLARLEIHGIQPDHTILLGFSQGACLALEYAARHPRRYGGLIGLSGGLIGPPGTSWNSPGSLEGTPVFLGCGDPDPHIPRERFLESAAVLRGMGAAVTAKLYPGLGHTVNRDEIQEIKKMLETLTGTAASPG
jgi:predicted esterase